MSTIHQDLLRHMQEQQAQRAIEEAKRKSSAGAWASLGAVGAAAALLWKFKAVILIGLTKLKFLAFGKLLTTGGTMLLAVVVYAQLWGFQYALGFVLLILVHEYGHVFAIRWYGLSASTPVFIPFLGAFVALKEMPRNAWMEAVIGIAGPVMGTLGAFFCMALYKVTGFPLYLALAYSGFMLNLFNLLPIVPLDGGRVAAAVSPKLWLLGTLAAGCLVLQSGNVILLLLLALGLPRVLGLFRGHAEGEAYYDIPPAHRLAMGFAFFGLAALLGYWMTTTHEALAAVRETMGGGETR